MAMRLLSKTLDDHFTDNSKLWSCETQSAGACKKPCHGFQQSGPTTIRMSAATRPYQDLLCQSARTRHLQENLFAIC
jgi:hypothetical protein